MQPNKICLFLLLLSEFFVHGIKEPEKKLVAMYMGEYILDMVSSSNREQDNLCYFKEERINPLEKMEREEIAKVKKPCGGSMTRMSDLIEAKDGDLLDAKHQLDLILCRGAALCALNWDDLNVVAQWKDKFICQEHIKELLTEWANKYRYYHNHKNIHGEIVCSMDPRIGGEHRTTARPLIRHRNALLQGESHALLQIENLHMHPGIQLCPKHKEYAVKTLADWVVRSAGRQLSPSPDNGRLSQSRDITSEGYSCSRECSPLGSDYSRHGSNTEAFEDSITVKEAFLSYARAAQVCNVDLRSESFLDLSYRQQRRKVQASRDLFDIQTRVMGGSGADTLKELTCESTKADDWNSRKPQAYINLMKNIAKNYRNAETRQEKIIILSMIALHMPASEIRSFIPGLTGYMITKAKRFAVKMKTHMAPDNKRVRFDPAAINEFVQFITSNTVSTGLPYGVRRVKYSDGTYDEVPNVLRQHRDAHIVDIYLNYLKDSGKENLALSRSTLLRILEYCTASRRKSLTAVDYFVADAAEALDNTVELLRTWKQKGLLGVDVAEYLINGITNGYQFLRTDYKLQIKDISRVADLCSQHALSDPKDKKFAKRCDEEDFDRRHGHDLKCDRCELLKNVLGHLRDVMEQVKENSNSQILAQSEWEEAQFTILNLEEKFFELKRHSLRSQFTSNERQHIVTYMEPGSALLTLDWAQKFLPTRHREKQTDYFGKRGLSYHIAHALTKNDDEFWDWRTHSFVHIVENDLQDSAAVTAILEHILMELKKIGIKEVYLRSDNAGCYHSSSTIASLPEISKKTGVFIARYSFSESQDGKGSCDRVAGKLKMHVKNFIDSGGNAASHEEFFNAVTWLDKLKGTSVYLGHIVAKKKSSTKFPQISNLNSFVFHKNYVTTYRYNRIGEGFQVKYEKMEPNDSSFQLKKEGGFTASSDMEFWAHYQCRNEDRCHETGMEKGVRIIDEKEADFEQETVSGDDDAYENAFQCPVEGCVATFLRYNNLEKHMEIGDHQFVPERQTLRDMAIHSYKKTLEEGISFGTSSFIEKAFDQLRTEHNEVDNLEAGWALKQPRTHRRFSEDVQQFLKECFEQGEKNRKKMDPKEAQKLMKTAKDTHGNRRFHPNEWLNESQIKSFWYKLQQKITQFPTGIIMQTEPILSEEDHEGEIAEEYRKSAETLTMDDNFSQIIHEHKDDLFHDDSSEETPAKKAKKTRASRHLPTL